MNHSFNVIKYAKDDDGVNFSGMLIVFCEWNLPGRGPDPYTRMTLK